MAIFKEKALNRLDVDRKIITVIAFGLFCAFLLIATVNISINTTSGLRAFVAGEGIWAKAQKEAGMHLSHYIISEDEEEYQHFLIILRINEGDRIAREELQKDKFDYKTVYDGFTAGLNHPDDIDDMIKVVRRFGNFSFVKSAIDIWTTADDKIEEFKAFAASIHSEIQNSDSISTAQKGRWMQELEDIDHELTDLEYNFSQAMGNMTRLVNEIFRWTTISLGLILIVIGLWLTIRFYNATQTWTKALRESEQKLKNVLDNSKDVLYKLDLKTKKYVFVSPTLENMLGYKKESFIEGGVAFILSIMHPEDKERMSKVVENYDHLDDGDFLPSTEFRLKESQGNWKWVSNVRTLIRDEHGEPEAIVGAVRDISTQKEQEDQIKKSLKEKEILLQEIHHRVKNNLSIISSLLELQKSGLSDEVKNVLSSSQSRIKSIAKVHEKLYQTTTLSAIPMDTYISEITEEIKKAYHSEQKKIDISIDAEPISMTINRAITIALILNELINNAYKHAFKDAKEGSIKISLKKSEERMELVVANNGRQIDDNIDITKSGSLGMTLLKVLAKRINGTVEIETGEWTRFKINFKSVQVE